jgi:DNA transformation protein
MAPDQDFVDYVCELLAPLGRASARRMFGGHGVYLDGTMLAIVFGGALYLKVDDASRARFEAEGSRPFVYRDATQEIAMSYWSAPEAALDSAEAMAPWARLARDAALRKAAAQAARRGAAPRPRVERPRRPRTTTKR